MKTKKLKYIVITLTLVITILGASLFSSMLTSQSQVNNELKPQIMKLQSLLDKGLESGEPDFKYSSLAQTNSGEVELMELTGFPMHHHQYANHFFYILKGQADLQIGSMKTRVEQGDLIVIPAGKKNEHKLQTTDGKPLQILSFKTPPENTD
jgi:mannose-6-phosphate isomerase-like protein (cupin superfamily)